MAYTPKPWHIESKAYPHILHNCGRRIPTTLDNAVLMAAAPELLEELQSAVEVIETWHKDYAPCDAKGCALCLELPKWQAAIDKALVE